MIKRGIILAIFLFAVMLIFSLMSVSVVSAEGNETNQTPAITCYSHKDCPQSFQYWCNGLQACQRLNLCENPGTPESKCSIKEDCMNCEQGCKDGQCQTIKCYQNSDCGEQTIKKYCNGKEVCKSGGGECINAGTVESFCQYPSCEVCQYGCENGECIKQSEETCTDSDGSDYYTQGKACSGNYCEADYCKGNTIIEYGCIGNKPSTIFTYGCPAGCQNGACGKGEIVSEQIKCVFENSKAEQTCYSEGAKCSGTEACIVDVSGENGKQLVWKSTCGGYAYTTIDANTENAIFNCAIETAPISPVTTEKPIEVPRSFRNAYWQCPDGFEEKQGDETSCKPAEVWKKYAYESCNKHCYLMSGKGGYENVCGVSSFSVYNECSLEVIVKPAVCGNGVCESGEWQVCEIAQVACKEGEICRASAAKCYIRCEQDCPKEKEGIYAKLNEKFNLQVSQEAKFDYKNLVVKFNDLFVPKCKIKEETNETVIAVVEKYSMTGKAISDTSISDEKKAIRECVKEPYAVLQLKFYEEKKDKTEITEVIKLQLGERKQVSDFAVSFLDYNQEGKSGLFLVSSANEVNFTCPKNCICDISGNVKECRKIGECPEKQLLCPDGICRDKCEIANITTECKFGCFYQEKCLPYGLRVSGLYCGISNDMKMQLQADESCDNNFECGTNVCIDGKCVSSNIIKKFFDWLKGLFGRA